MPIKINLLAEARAAEELRRRDPVKRCAYGGAFLVVLFLVWFSTKLAAGYVDTGALTQVQTEIDQHTNEYSHVMVNQNKITDAKRKLAALQDLSTNRFLQGDLLNALQQTAIIPGVQLTHLKVDQAFLYAEGTPGQASGDHKVIAHPATVVEKDVVTIDARDSGDNPSVDVSKFKEAILKQPYFQTMLDKTNGIQLTGLSAPQMGSNAKPYVMFTLECNYTDQSR
jgi:hypothetical protein